MMIENKYEYKVNDPEKIKLLVCEVLNGSFNVLKYNIIGIRWIKYVQYVKRLNGIQNEHDRILFIPEFLSIKHVTKIHALASAHIECEIELNIEELKLVTIVPCEWKSNI